MDSDDEEGWKGGMLCHAYMCMYVIADIVCIGSMVASRMHMCACISLLMCVYACQEAVMTNLGQFNMHITTHIRYIQSQLWLWSCGTLLCSPPHGDCHTHQGGRGEQLHDVLHHLLEVCDVTPTVQSWGLQGDIGNANQKLNCKLKPAVCILGCLPYHFTNKHKAAVLHSKVIHYAHHIHSLTVSLVLPQPL